MKKYTKEIFVEKARKIHGDNIDFSDFEYVNSTTSGLCRCNICGYEWGTRPDVILRGCGCRKCFNNRHSKSKKLPLEVIQGRLDDMGAPYYIIEDSYIDTKHVCKTKCLICGHIWEVKPNDLLNGHGCPQCAIEKQKCSQEEAINKLRNKYGDRFLYDDAIYNGCHDKITLICSKCGKEIATSYNRFITCDINCSCSRRYKKSKLELALMDYFEEKNIQYINNHVFDWLKQGYGQLSLDFYLPIYNMAIECQGEQHFKPKTFGGILKEQAEENFQKQKERDIRKKRLCEENGIQLIYFLDKKFEKYMNKDNIYFTNIDELIEFVK